MLEIGTWVMWRIHGGADLDPLLHRIGKFDKAEGDGYDYYIERWYPEYSSLYAYSDEIEEVFPEAEVIS